MEKHDNKDQDRGQAQAEDEQVICSNELLKAIRERMRKRKLEERESRGKEPE